MRKTDAWNWGVTVLERFVGRVPCYRGGYRAAEVLEEYLARPPADPGRPRTPAGAAGVLRRDLVVRFPQSWR